MMRHVINQVMLRLGYVVGQPSLCVVTSIGHNPSLCYYLGYVRVLILEQFLPNHYVSDSTNKPGELHSHTC